MNLIGWSKVYQDMIGPDSDHWTNQLAPQGNYDQIRAKTRKKRDKKKKKINELFF